MPEENEAQPSLAESMAATYSEMEADETEETPDGVETPQAAIPDPEETEDETEVVAAGDDTATDDQQTDDETSDDEKPLAAPEHWSDDDKKVFSEMDAGGQEFLLRRHREMEADYTRKTKEVAEQRKTLEPLEQVLAPYRATYAPHGMTDAQAVQRLFNAQASLASNPVETLKYLAQTYGVDLGTLAPAENQSDSYTDPEIKSLRDQVNQLNAQLQQQGTNQVSAQQQQYQQQIDSFVNATDADGKVLHPHFKTVENRMAALISAERQLGNTLTLDDAYEKAVMLDPQVRSETESAARKLAEQELEKQAAMRAAKAKKAARTNIESGGASGGKAKPPKDIKSALHETAAQMGL